MAGQDKRVIEQQATSEVFADDWFLKDSVTEGTTKISSENLKAWINDGMATDEEIETIVENIADTYSESESYAEGDLCIHEYALFKCTGTTTGTWDSTKWQATTVAELLDSIDLSAEAISYDNTASGLEAENVQDAIDETITKLSAVGSASGAIATFTDGANLPMPKLEVGIEPQQDLHGYDSPWVGGAGKNKWEFNSSLSGNGNVLGGKDFTNQIPIGTYTLSCKGTFASGGAMAFRFVYTDNTTKDVTLGYNLQSGTYYASAAFDKAVKALSYVYSNNANNNINSIQLEQGSTATSYAPYSNICPISGWDEVNVYNLNDSTKAPFFRGLLNGTYNFNNLGSLTWYKSNETFYAYLPEHKVVAGNYPIKAISSNGMEFLQMPGSGNVEYIMITDSDYASYTAAQFKGAMNGVYLIYELATPTTPTITPQQFNTLLEAFNINGHTYTIDLDGTRYGGEVDVVNGVLTVDRVMIDLSTVSFTYDANNKRWSRQFSDMKNYSARSADLMFEQYEATVSAYTGDTGTAFAYGKDIYIYDANQSLTISGKCVYELATPLTIQLTPTVVKSLRGVNNISADSGAILDAEYIRDMTTIINYILEQLNS